MRYELRFRAEALREWRRLDEVVRGQFKQKLAERLDHPWVPAANLRGRKDRYKIEFRGAGFRLVYEVRETEVVVVVVAVGKREHSTVYKAAARR